MSWRAARHEAQKMARGRWKALTTTGKQTASEDKGPSERRENQDIGDDANDDDGRASGPTPKTKHNEHDDVLSPNLIH